MAIAQMVKVMIVSHRSQTKELLEAVQQEGILEVLGAERAMVSKDWPELAVEAKRPRSVEKLIEELEKSLEFLSVHSSVKKTMLSVLAPRMVVENKQYSDIVSGRDALQLLEHAQDCQGEIAELESEYDNCISRFKMLQPWENLSIPVEQLGDFKRTACLAGLIPQRRLEEALEQIAEFGAVLETVGSADGLCACVVICLKEYAADVHKAIRAVDFDVVGFEGMNGTAFELIAKYREKLEQINEQLTLEKSNAAELSKQHIKLGVLFDHYQNLAQREKTRIAAPATERTVLLEGWVKKKDYPLLEKIVSGFNACSISKITPGEDEPIPVEIDNNHIVKPFEVITRLYGMPRHVEIDPTALLTPFFMLFFALCLTDVGYALIIIAFSAFMISKMQGDKKLLWLLMSCSILTIFTGALTGGWFGDAPQQLSQLFGWTWIAKARLAVMWFDPLEKPMIFFFLAVGLGYLHIMTGLTAAFVNNIRRKEFIAAIFDQLVWLVMLNSIVLRLFGKKFGLSQETSIMFGRIALVPAALIVLFSSRQGGWFGRVAMGCYNLFSTVFYMGDILSYLRLMALGMVTGGLAMAVNVMAKTASEVPYIGYVLMIVVLVAGHLFNTTISGLGAFVHTMRLQFVEFFPKFLSGSSRQFEPLTREYKYTYVEKDK